MERMISFTISGEVDTLITITELLDGTLRFDIEVLGSAQIGDLRALFFDLEGLTVGTTGLSAMGLDVNNQAYGENAIDRVEKDANIKGEVVNQFGDYDAGVEIGTSGMSGDDIQSTSFILSHDTIDLTLDMVSGADFGIRYTSVGEVGGTRSGSTKQGDTAVGAANDDAWSVEENSEAAEDLLANDATGAPGAVSSFFYGGTTYQAGESALIVVNGMEIGSLTVDASGNATFSATGADVDALAEGATEVIAFAYQSSEVVNGQTQSAIANASVTVAGKNDAPTLAAGLMSVSEDGPSGSLDLSGLGADLDSDDDGSTLGYAISSAPGLGSATITGSSLSFDPSGAVESLAEGETQELSIGVTATDSHGATASADMTVTVTGKNDAPTLAAGMLAASEDGPAVTLDLSALGDDIDSDNDGTDLVYSITSGPAAGLASLSGTMLTFDPDGEFESLAHGAIATQTIEITATDAHGAAATNIVEVEITGENDAPLLTGQTISVHEDSGIIYLAFEEIADDPDSDDTPWTLGYSVVGQPAAGLASIVGTSLAFDPNGEFEDLALGETRDVTVQIAATDGHGATTNADIIYTITGRNDAPTLEHGLLAFMEDGPAATLDLASLAGDVDSDDDPTTLTYAIEAIPNQGIATLTGSTLSFDPNGTREWLSEGQVYEHSMWVSATDAHGEKALAHITLSGTGQNDAPTLASGTLAAAEDGPDAVLDLAALGDDIDLDDDGSSLNYTISSGPSAGLAAITGTELTFSANGDFEHLAEGATQQVTLEITATDAHGLSAVSEVTVTITGQNDAPILSYAGPPSVQENSFRNEFLGYRFSDPDEDDDASSLTYAVLSQPAQGNVYVSNGNLYLNFLSAYDYLDAGETAIAWVGISATDSHGATTIGHIGYTVSGTNDAPVITGGQTTGTVEEDGVLVASGSLSATPGDANDTISWSIEGGGTGAYGTMTLDQGGNWSYQLDNANADVQALDSGESLTDSFVFEVLDDDGLSVTTSVDITIEGADDSLGDGVFSAAFVTGAAKPWNVGSYVTNMNTVFGSSWDDLSAPTENIFDDGYDFLWIDGGDGQTNWFLNFVNNWRPEMEQYVSDGGTLLLNAARWFEEQSFYLGFGATLQYSPSYSANATGAATPITNGTYGNAGTSWTGSYFAHDYVTGAGFTPLLSGTSGVILMTSDYGAGQVAVGGMTASIFHSSGGDILEQNILDYTASHAEDYAFL